MRTGPFEPLQIAVELLAYFCVCRDLWHPFRLECIPTSVIEGMKNVVPATTILKIFRCTVEGVFIKLAGEVVEQMLRWCWFVLVKSRKGIFASFRSWDYMKSVAVTMDWAKKTGKRLNILLLLPWGISYGTQGVGFSLACAFLLSSHSLCTQASF